MAHLNKLRITQKFPEQFARLRIVGALVAVGLLSACANQGSSQSSSGVIIDTQGVNMDAYYQDLHECRNYASQVSVAGRTTTGAVAGAVLGGVVGAITGDSGSAQRGAGVGGVVGGVKGASSGYQEKHQVVRNCLRGRGYSVLN
ncbi:MAG: glycine zipper family protein [Porticoccaceae bacterium]|nr:glycine zipper family protein [Porticoccaceae bacterium]